MKRRGHNYSNNYNNPHAPRKSYRASNKNKTQAYPPQQPNWAPEDHDQPSYYEPAHEYWPQDYCHYEDEFDH